MGYRPGTRFPRPAPVIFSLCARFREPQAAFATILRMPIRRFIGFVTLSLAFLICGIMSSCNSSNRKTPDKNGSIASSFGVVPDLDRRLAGFKPLDMPFARASLSPREQRLVEKLVDASNAIEQIYWRQSDPEGLSLYQSLEKSQDSLDRKVLRFLKINGSRYDLIDGLKPFVGTQAAPPGRALYPLDLTSAQIEQYVAANPQHQNSVYDPRSVLRRNGTQLESVPYRTAFAQLLKQAAEDLREAARSSDDPAFASFLELRAEALLSDDYYRSDLA